MLKRKIYPTTSSELLDTDSSVVVSRFLELYDEHKVRTKLIPIILYKFKKQVPDVYPEIQSGSISVRVLEHFFTKYLYSHPVYFWNKGEFVDVLESYKKTLRKYGGKRGMDVYRRGPKLKVRVGSTTVVSAVPQLRCFTWMEERGILDWLLEPRNTRHVLKSISEFLRAKPRPKLPNRKGYAKLTICEKLLETKIPTRKEDPDAGLYTHVDQ
jgi:hypothetical protein